MRQGQPRREDRFLFSSMAPEIFGIAPAQVFHDGEVDQFARESSGETCTRLVALDQQRVLLIATRQVRPEMMKATERAILHCRTDNLAALVEKMRGPFAFALWDGDRRELHLGRDQFGEQPLFFRRYSDGSIGFCSRITPLLDEGSEALNHRHFAAFLRSEIANSQDTFFDSVQRVPPAHILTFTSSACRAYRYWQPALLLDREQICSDAQWTEAFAEHFGRAVQRAMAGACKPIVMLSGGMDSSAVACVAAKHANLASFTLLYGTGPDERNWARAVIEAKHLTAHYLNVDEVYPLEGVDEMIEALEEPFENPGLAVGWAGGRAMAKIGTDRVLDGTFGDSTISYDPRFLSVLVRDRPLEALKEAVLNTRHMHGDRAGPWPIIKDFMLKPLLGIHTGNGEGHPYQHCLHPDLANTVQASGYMAPGPPRTWRELRKMHLAEATGALSMRSVEIRRRLVQPFGLESGHPFADVDLLEFAIGLPWDQRVRDGLTRYIVRKALYAELPDKIRQRGGKWSPIGVQCDRFAALPHCELDDELGDGPGPAKGLIDWSEVMSALGRMRTNSESFESGDLITLWIGFSVKRWMRQMRVHT